MLGSLARRERRPLWGVLAFILAIVIGLSLWAASNARGEAEREAALDAELAAQTELAPLLQTRDLTNPITGARAAELAASIDRSITQVSPIDHVRIFSSLGRILYSEDPKFTGTRPSYLRNLTFEVASGESQSLTRDAQLLTYVPVWLNPGGAVAVAELSQPLGPISAEATARWYRIAAIAVVLLLGSIAMIVVTTKAPARSATPVQLYGPAAARPLRPGQFSATPEPPIYEHAGFRAIEEQRQDAERRSHALEENFRAVQKRLKESLAHVKELEGRLAMNETQNSTNDGELQALRDQLRQTSERLHETELDNNALRERMSLRQQELDEARRMLVEVRSGSGSPELRTRLEAAERRTEELVLQVEQLEGELERETTKLHMSKFSEALRELEHEALEIEEEDDLFEHPVIIRNTPGHPSHERVR
jgi:hypothetical protein